MLRERLAVLALCQVLIEVTLHHASDGQTALDMSQTLMLYKGLVIFDID